MPLNDQHGSTRLSRSDGPGLLRRAPFFGAAVVDVLCDNGHAG